MLQHEIDSISAVTYDSTPEKNPGKLRENLDGSQSEEHLYFAATQRPAGGT